MRMWTRLLIGCLVAFAFGTALADTGHAIQAQAFFQFAQFGDVKVSPDGKYLADIVVVQANKKPRTQLEVIDLTSMHEIGSYTFSGQQPITDIWWVTNTQILFTVYVSGSAETIWMMNINGNDVGEIVDHGKVLNILHRNSGEDGWAIIERLNTAPQYVYGFGFGKDMGFPKVVGAKYVSCCYVKSPLYGGRLYSDNDGILRLAMGFNALTIKPEMFYHKPGTYSWDWVDISTLIADEPRYTGYGPIMLTADNKQFYFTGITPAGTIGLYRVDPQTLEKTLLYSNQDYDIQNEFNSYTNFLISADGKSFLAFEYLRERPEWILIDQSAPETKLLVQLENAFNGQNVVITSAALDGSRVVFFVSNDRNPGAYYLYDVKTAKAQFLFNVLPGIDLDAMSPMQPISFKARDGLTIHGYLTLPLGRTKDLPLIVLPHGGPFGIRDQWGFDPEVQYFAYHGYAVLQVEYRGSGGYGYAFQKAGYRQWGGAMQDDLTDATRWAIQQGVADSSRICIYGGGYGGYAALEGVVKEPDLYKCAVGYAGVYDLLKFRSRTHTLHFQNEIPAMTTELGDDENYLKAHSPVFHVDRIKAALFLAHGGEDETVPISQADELRDALDKVNKPYVWVYYRNEGHGFYTLDHKVDLYTKMLVFFDKYIGPDSTHMKPASAGLSNHQ